MTYKTAICVALAVIASVLLAVAWRLYESGQLGGKPGLQTRLFSAIWSNDTNEVVSVLADGADLNGPSSKVNRPTPLIDSVTFGRLEITQMLLAKGADPNRTDWAGYGALYHAMNNIYLGGPDDKVSGKIVIMLINHGANPNGKGVGDALGELPPDDPRREAYKSALAELNSSGTTNKVSP